MPVMSVKEVLKFITDDTHGKVFGVTFIKRSTGEIRKMSAKYGVKKHLTTGIRTYNFEERDLVPVFDMNNGYRCIPIEGLVSITISGVEYEITH